MLPTLARRQFMGLIPPKIATPSHLSAGSGEGLAPLVNFYSKLPKGPAPPTTFNPERKALNRLGLTILFFFGVGYTIDYNMHLISQKPFALGASQGLSGVPVAMFVNHFKSLYFLQ